MLTEKLELLGRDREVDAKLAEEIQEKIMTEAKKLQSDLDNVRAESKRNTKEV